MGTLLFLSLAGGPTLSITGQGYSCWRINSICELAVLCLRLEELFLFKAKLSFGCRAFLWLVVLFFLLMELFPCGDRYLLVTGIELLELCLRRVFSPSGRHILPCCWESSSFHWQGSSCDGWCTSGGWQSPSWLLAGSSYDWQDSPCGWWSAPCRW